MSSIEILIYKQRHFFKEAEMDFVKTKSVAAAEFSLGVVPK